MNIAEILYYKFPEADFRKDIILQDDSDGKGPYIKEWNLPVPKPDSVTLALWEAEIGPIKEKLNARQNRRDNYPAIGDQLDMLYKAMDAGVLPKVDDFYNSIKAVKDQFPIKAV